MAEKALVLSADSWEMADEKTGELRMGWSLWYVNSYREDSAKSIGFKPSKVSITNELAADLRGIKLPAVAELDFGSRPGQAGKATLTITGFKVLASVDLDTLGATSPAKKAA